EQASLDAAIQIFRIGALDYLIKPFDFDELAIRIEKIRHYKRLWAENQVLRRMTVETHANGGIVAESPSMRDVLRAVRKVAPTQSTVLISGESGVGKELIAREIHKLSPHAERPFIPVNVSAVPTGLMESRFFGHMRGSFTGASGTHRGLFQIARGGTVFLDEIGELPLEIQPKLLRALEGGEIFPIGAETPSHVEFRLIAATNRDLRESVAHERFRDDLYYRLNVFHIRVPALRERPEDIPPLVDRFVRELAVTMNKPIEGVEREALDLLVRAEWRGNVRELRNVLERAVILADGPWIGVADLASLQPLEGDVRDFRLDSAMSLAERRHIEVVLRLHGYNRRDAARALGVSLATFYRRLEKHGILERIGRGGPSHQSVSEHAGEHG
ncbi:MAG: sigma-54-dependent Fis family transcriptional regulator, partial [Myxococcales bacterium]|nr:sigma-54-dependent Fis family transcriptional regulator [Myxococcales bacterium]